MKYLFFIAAVIGIMPCTVLLLCYRRLIGIATLGLILPLLAFDGTAINFFSNETYRGTSRGMEISLIYIIAVVILLVLCLLKNYYYYPFPETGSRIYLLYFLLCLPSLKNAENTFFCFFELWKMLMIFLVFLAVYFYLVYSNGDVDMLLYGMAAFVLIDFPVLLMQHHRGIYQPSGVFPHQNSLAMYMLMTGPLFIARYLNNYDKYSKLFLLAFMVSSVTLFRTYSRGAIMCCPFGIAVTLLLSMWKAPSLRKTYILSIIFFISLIGLVYFVPRVVQRFINAPEASGATRKYLAIAAVNMMKDKPLAGVGLNNWGIKINPPYEYSEHEDGRDLSDDDFRDGIVETIYLLVGAECGIPCMIVLLLWFGYYMYTSFRLLSKLRRTKYFYVPAGVFGALTGIYMQSTLEWILKQQINFISLMILFAMISYLNKYYRKLRIKEMQEDYARTLPADCATGKLQ